MKHQQSSEALGAGKLELDWPCYLVETRPQRQCARRQHYQSIQYTLACYFLLFMLAWPRGAVNCQDSSLKHKQQRHHARLAESATSGTLAAAKQDCAPDCLASPLVAIVDRQRLDAYLLSGSQRKHTRAHLGGAAGSRHLEYPVGVGKLHYGTSSLATPLHNKRPAYLGPLDLHTPDHMSSRSVQSAKRLKSDENCPMTGPMTLCDQIDSYPAELILSKLAAVKEALRWSSFNLDSLFTDEREHSSEPFNETLSSPASDRSSQHRANASASPGRPNIDRALGQWQRHGQTGDSGRRTYRSAMAEFVDLVERRAIKLDGSGSQTQAGYLRRARRQAGSSMPSSAFSSSSQVSSAVQVLASAGSQAELEDPERAATFADSNPLPSFTEPICRVRSIYISPRAAVSLPPSISSHFASRTTTNQAKQSSS